MDAWSEGWVENLVTVWGYKEMEAIQPAGLQAASGEEVHWIWALKNE